MTSEAVRRLVGAAIIMHLGGSAFAGQNQRVLAQIQRDGVLDRRVIVIAPNLSKQTVDAMARQFLSSTAGKARLRRLLFGTSEEELARAVAHPGTYDRARQIVMEYGYPSHPIAEVLSIDENTVVRYWSNGRTEEWNVSGARDPSIFQVGTNSFKLLHFQVHPLAGQFAKSHNLPQYFVSFYFETHNKLSAERTALLTHKLIDLIGLRAVDVRVRNDPWFLGNTDFPDVYRFMDRYELPTRDQFEKAPWVICSNTFGKFNCTMKGQRTQKAK